MLEEEKEAYNDINIVFMYVILSSRFKEKITVNTPGSVNYLS